MHPASQHKPCIQSLCVQGVLVPAQRHPVLLHGTCRSGEGHAPNVVPCTCIQPHGSGRSSSGCGRSSSSFIQLARIQCPCIQALGIQTGGIQYPCIQSPSIQSARIQSLPLKCQCTHLEWIKGHAQSGWRLWGAFKRREATNGTLGVQVCRIERRLNIKWTVSVRPTDPSIELRPW